MGNAPSAVPYGAAIGFLNTTVTCNVQYQGQAQPPFTTNLQVSATAPLLSNGQFNYTDLHASLATGGSAYTLIVNTDVTFATNATPATFTISSSQVQDGTVKTANAPLYNNVTTAGPITIGSQPAVLSVTQVNVHAFNADEDFKLSCTPPTNIILTTANGQSQASTSAPANGFLSTPSTPVNSTTNIANLPLSCGGPTYGLIVGGTVPSSTKNRAQFLLSSVNTFFSFVTGTDTAYDLTLGKDTSGNAKGGLTAELPGATESQVDFCREFVASDPNTSNPISGGAYTDGKVQNLTLALPHYGSLSKNFTTVASNVSPGPFQVKMRYLQGTLNTNNGASFISCSIGSNILLSIPFLN